MRVTFGDSVATATGFTVMRVKMDNPPGELAVFSGNAHLERGNADGRRSARRRKRDAQRHRSQPATTWPNPSSPTPGTHGTLIATRL